MNVARRPQGLRAAGRRAWDRAMAELTEPERERFADVSERFARQVDVAEALRREWTGLGRPVLTEGSSGGKVTHPLISAMRQVDATIANLARALKLAPAAAEERRPQGRPVGATSAPDRKPTGEPPRIRRIA